MRRVLLSAIVAVMALGFVPANADATEKGFILAPTRFTDGTSGFPGAHRRVYDVSQGLGNGTLGYVVKIAASESGATFTIGDVTDATGMADLDVQFYDDLGSEVDGRPAVANGNPIATRAPGGETGMIPSGAVAAIVFMPTGLNASFTWSVAAAE